LELPVAMNPCVVHDRRPRDRKRLRQRQEFVGDGIWIFVRFHVWDLDDIGRISCCLFFSTRGYLHNLYIRLNGDLHTYSTGIKGRFAIQQISQR